MAFKIKIALQDDLRRSELSEKTYARLVELILSAYQLPAEAASQIIVRYIDDENELVHMSSDYELEEAFALAESQDKILKVFVSLVDPEEHRKRFTSASTADSTLCT